MRVEAAGAGRRGRGRVAATIDEVVGDAAEGVEGGGGAADPAGQQERGGAEAAGAAAQHGAAGGEVGEH